MDVNKVSVLLDIKSVPVKKLVRDAVDIFIKSIDEFSVPNHARITTL
jgi:hypothetical protein